MKLILLLLLIVSTSAYAETQAERSREYASLTRRAEVALSLWNGGSNIGRFLEVYRTLRGCAQYAPRPDLGAQHCYDLAVALEAFGEASEALSFYRHAEDFAVRAIARKDIWESEGARLRTLSLAGAAELERTRTR